MGSCGVVVHPALAAFTAGSRTLVTRGTDGNLVGGICSGSLSGLRATVAINRLCRMCAHAASHKTGVGVRAGLRSIAAQPSCGGAKADDAQQAAAASLGSGRGMVA